jgi:integrase
LRRSRGEGSAYRRKDGLWVTRYEAAGRRKYLYRKTRKVVADKLRERRSWGKGGPDPQGNVLCVGAYLDRWLPTVRGTVKERTWVRHEEMVRLHLKLPIWGLKLQKLSPLDVQELYLSRHDSALSSRRFRFTYVTLHKALKQAVRWSGLLLSKVSAAVR